MEKKIISIKRKSRLKDKDREKQQITVVDRIGNKYIITI